MKIALNKIPVGAVKNGRTIYENSPRPLRKQEKIETLFGEKERKKNNKKGKKKKSVNTHRPPRRKKNKKKQRKNIFLIREKERNSV